MLPLQPVAVCAPDTRILVSVSVKLATVRATELALVNVKVIVDVPPALIVVGENALAIVGATVVTVRHCGVTLLVRLASPVTRVLVLVNAAGSPVHEALT